MTRPLAGLVVPGLVPGLVYVVLLAAQDATAPLAPIALVPPSFTIERACAAAEFTVAFQLGEEGPSRLEIALDDLDEKKQPVHRHTLALDFDPFEGARFRYGVMADATSRTPSESALLTQATEPRGLRYELRIRLPAGRGLEVTLGDGSPLLVATTPRAASIGVSFTTSGSVMGLSASAVTRPGSPALAEAFAKLPPRKDSPPDLPSQPQRKSNLDWAIVTLTPAAEAPAPIEVHPLEPRTAQEGTVERIVLEPVEGVQLPAIVVKSGTDEAGASKRRGMLVVAGGPRGKNDAAALAHVAAQARSGMLVAAVDLLGCGERPQFQPHDSLTTYELQLVGKSAGEYATQEIRQLLAWMAQRPDVDPAQVGLWVDATTQEVLQRAGAVAGTTIGTGTLPDPASSELADAARFTEDEVRIRYDSWLLGDLFELRDQVATPDRSVPLLERMNLSHGSSGSPALLGPLLTWNAKTGARWATSIDFASVTGGITLCASDLGPLTAIELAVQAHAQGAGSDGAGDGAGDMTWIALDDGPNPSGDPINPGDPGDRLRTRVDKVGERLFALVKSARSPRKLRLFGEGSCGVVMLLAAMQHPDFVESVTALHSIPSFEILLYRPLEASRAAPVLGVLTQGMPAELFVKDALARFELEECVLELRKQGVAVDWRDPVDALRRPLSRHDRLAMWPRVRRLDRTR